VIKALHCVGRPSCVVSNYASPNLRTYLQAMSRRRDSSISCRLVLEKQVVSAATGAYLVAFAERKIM
jgi:hypothetical protein